MNTIRVSTETGRCHDAIPPTDIPSVASGIKTGPKHHRPRLASLATPLNMLGAKSSMDSVSEICHDWTFFYWFNCNFNCGQVFQQVPVLISIYCLKETNMYLA